METPVWAYVIGIMMILFGGCSITGNLQSINYPNILDRQQEILEGFSAKNETPQIDSLESDINKIAGLGEQQILNNMAKSMKEMFSVSEFTKKWMVRFGYIGLIFSILYVFAGIFLLIKKNFSINLAYSALALSIILSIVKSIVLSSDSSGGSILMISGFSQIFEIIIDIILLTVIVASDKTAYKTLHE